MENQTTFDLNQAIQNWRNNLAQSPAFECENLNELESHLRDSIATLQSRGLSAEEAFMIATKRIGSGYALETEFKKLNYKTIWAERLLWMLLGIQVWQIANSLVWTLSQNLLAFSWKFGWKSSAFEWDRQEHHGMTLWIVAFTVVRFISVAASAWFAWWLVFRKGSQWHQWLAAKLQQRRSFIGYCISASLLLLTFQAVVFYLLPGLSFRSLRDGNGSPGEAVQFIQSAGYADLIVRITLIVTMVVLTLFLLRKRASSAATISTFAR